MNSFLASITKQNVPKYFISIILNAGKIQNWWKMLHIEKKKIMAE